MTRAEGRLESLGRPWREVHGRELQPRGRLRLARAARERRQVLVESVPSEFAMWYDVENVVQLVLRRGHRIVQAGGRVPERRIDEPPLSFTRREW